MTKVKAVEILEKTYKDLIVVSMVEEPDRFVADMVRKDGQAIVGGTKAVIKSSGKATEINPLLYDGLIKKLTSKSAKI